MPNPTNRGGVTCRIHSYTLDGLQARPIVVDTDLRAGLPSLTILDVAEQTARVVRGRIRAALASCGYEMPSRRITVRVLPTSAAVTDEDITLPIALGILAASRQIPPPADHVAVVGGLGLIGEIRRIRGILPIAEAARRDRRTALILPTGTIREAALVDELPLREVQWLTKIAAALQTSYRDDRQRLPAPRAPHASPAPPTDDLTGYDDILQQLVAHDSVLLIGRRGVTTMLARQVPRLLPPMTDHEALEVTRIHSACGLLGDAIPVTERPFRLPHHTTSPAALLGTAHRPGEITLARHGVLHLDEPHRFAIDVLHELHHAAGTDGIVHRDGRRRVKMPTGNRLIGATTPCPCGASSPRPCRCTTEQRAQHITTLATLRDCFEITIDLENRA